jgi:hypothetical protein
MNTQSPTPACENLVSSYDFLERDFQRAIEKRLTRRGEDYMVPRILEIHDISHLEAILEALLEGHGVASMC